MPFHLARFTIGSRGEKQNVNMLTALLAPYRSFSKNLCVEEKKMNNNNACLSEVINCPPLAWTIKTWLKSGNQIALILCIPDTNKK